ncbi:MAG: Uncharacterized protein G01um101425_548 [Candidatus Peregrinibacteria bacterium Gr01-1014_25]|nr:MAG: Uncharacterized protein G01um101425_548 [Candidatus Peregrinibacteria bacterium Gr01-1014_25]
MKRFLIAVGILLELTACNPQPYSPTVPTLPTVPSSSPSPISSVPSISSFPPLPVPFSPQAPFAVWDPLHEETCEEMSLIMVHHFLTGAPLTREDAEGELLAMVAWEMRNGYAVDVTIDELARIAKDYYGYDATVYRGGDVTLKNIRRLIADGSPVIVPAAGQMLGNPYFSGEGPPYHMLVLTGFDATHIITNDPGTRRGEEYRYPHATVMDAIHDWTGDKETIREGERAMMVLHSPRVSP